MTETEPQATEEPGRGGRLALTGGLAAAVLDTPRALPRLGRSYLHSGWLHALARLYADAPSDRRREFAEALARRCLESGVHDSDDLSRCALRFLASSPWLDEETKETWRRTLRWCEANGATARYPAFELWP